MATVNHQDRPLDLICLGRVAVDFMGNKSVPVWKR